MALVEQAHDRTRWRFSLWLVFFGLSAAIISYPVNLKLQAYVVRSYEVFAGLPLFATLFYLWIAALLLLLFTSAHEGAARWEGLALIAMAALVLRGLWNLIAPLQHQSIAHAGAVKIWLQAGKIVRPGSYIEWPGLSVTTALIARVTGMSLLPSLVVQTLFVTVVVAVAAYVFLRRVLETSLPAALACLLVLEGSQWLHISYNPGPMGLAFLLLFLVVLFHKSGLGNRSNSVAAFLLMAAMTITYLFGAVFVFFVAFGIWVFGRLKRERQGEPGAGMTTVMLFFIMPVGWILYRGTDAFNFVTQSAYTRLVTASFLDLFDTIVSRGQAHVGEGVPSWVGVSRLFWFALLYVLGGFLWLWNLVGFRHLAPMGVRLVAAYSGLVLVTLVTGLSLVGGAPELRRSLTFGAFLGVPFLLLALQRHKPRVARVGFVGIASVLFLLSLPSFLSNALGIATWTFYDSEYSAGQWVHSLYGTGKGLRLFTTQYGAMPVQFYVTDATYTPDRQVYAYVSLGEEGVWQSMEELLDKFDRFSESGNPGLYIYTLKTALYSADVFGVHPDHAKWRQLTERISARYNRAYDNGPIEMYSSEILRQDRGQ